jgi:caa(3)-type oxidase subunit IV
MAKTPLAHAASENHDDHGHHIQPLSMYFGTAIFLTIFMILTIFAAIYLPQWAKMPLWLANLIAVGIACIKAHRVVFNFMHLKWSSTLAKLWAFIGLFFLPVLFSIGVDFLFRHHEPAPSWTGYPETALPRKIGSMDGSPLRPEDSNKINRTAKGGMSQG